MKKWLMRLAVVVSVCLLVFTLVGTASAKPKKGTNKSTRPQKTTFSHVVQKGESVDKIAKMYDVSPEDIARWNNLTDVHHIRRGQTLRIRVLKSSEVAKHIKEINTRINSKLASEKTSVYVVKKGDSLGKISRKTGVSIEDIKRYNKSLRQNPDKLKTGQKLVLRDVAGDGDSPVTGKSVSRGLANAGSLSGGIQLINGPGYTVRNPKRSYGTALTVNLIAEAMRAYARKFRNGPKFSIGDLSVQGGGRLPPHLSHQSGRDVDITMLRHSNGTLDIEKNWFVMEYFLKTKKVQYIFLDYNLQKGFYDYARKKGYSDSQLRTWIQYPNGKKSYHSIIRHSNGHIKHFHVRFVCASTDVKCR